MSDIPELTDMIEAGMSPRSKSIELLIRENKDLKNLIKSEYRIGDDGFVYRKNPIHTLIVSDMRIIDVIKDKS